MPWTANIAKTMTSNGKQFTVTREMLTTVARDRWNLSAVFKFCFCFVLLYNKSLNDWSRNSEYCFPRISMFPSTSSREILRFSGNKIHCSPRDQSLSVYWTLNDWSRGKQRVLFPLDLSVSHWGSRGSKTLMFQTGKHLLRTQNVSEQNQKYFLCPQQMMRARANGETFVSATMCPQQCVLVCRGLYGQSFSSYCTYHNVFCKKKKKKKKKTWNEQVLCIFKNMSHDG